MSDDEDCEYEYPSDVDDDDLPSTPYAPASPVAKKQKNILGPPLLPPPPPGGLLRQTSTSYQLVIPRDSYVIRSALEIQPLLDALVDETSRLFAISLDEAQILLQQCKWNKERMIEKFYSDEEKLRKEACLDLFCPDVRCEATEDVTCRICYDPVSPDQVYALGCRHFFCRDCYGGYLESSVADGPICVLTHCAEPNCMQRVPKSFFHAVAPDGVAGRFDQYMLKNFIKTSLSMNYCPAPRCDKVSIGSGITTIQCECGSPYCFKCGLEAHDPCSCDQLSKWQMKNSDDSETANWLLTHTKMCPKCKSSTEKNEGCNHMTCKICQHHYCWICMGDWKDHNNFYTCNRFDPKKLAESDNSVAHNAKHELERYLHYYRRYERHAQALKAAANLRNKGETPGTEFIKAAAEQLIKCRRVLKYTYVMGYYLPDGTPEKGLFEHHQEMLEKNTEKLHDYTQQPCVEKLDAKEVINMTRIIARFLDSLLESLHGGTVHNSTESI